MRFLVQCGPDEGLELRVVRLPPMMLKLTAARRRVRAAAAVAVAGRVLLVIVRVVDVWRSALILIVCVCVRSAARLEAQAMKGIDLVHRANSTENEAKRSTAAKGIHSVNRMLRIRAWSRSCNKEAQCCVCEWHQLCACEAESSRTSAANLMADQSHLSTRRHFALLSTQSRSPHHHSPTYPPCVIQLSRAVPVSTGPVCASRGEIERDRPLTTTTSPLVNRLQSTRVRPETGPRAESKRIQNNTMSSTSSPAVKPQPQLSFAAIAAKQNKTQHSNNKKQSQTQNKSNNSSNASTDTTSIASKLSSQLVNRASAPKLVQRNILPAGAAVAVVTTPTPTASAVANQQTTTAPSGQSNSTSAPTANSELVASACVPAASPSPTSASPALLPSAFPPLAHPSVRVLPNANAARSKPPAIAQQNTTSPHNATIADPTASAASSAINSYSARLHPSLRSGAANPSAASQSASNPSAQSTRSSAATSVASKSSAGLGMPPRAPVSTTISTAPLVDPSLQSTIKQLVKSQKEDTLRSRLDSRRSVEELIAKGILSESYAYQLQSQQQQTGSYAAVASSSASSAAPNSASTPVAAASRLSTSKRVAPAQRQQALSQSSGALQSDPRSKLPSSVQPSIHAAGKTLLRHFTADKLKSFLANRPSVRELLSVHRRLLRDTMTWHRVERSGAACFVAPRNCHSMIFVPCPSDASDSRADTQRSRGSSNSTTQNSRSTTPNALENEHSESRRLSHSQSQSRDEPASVTQRPSEEQSNNYLRVESQESSRLSHRSHSPSFGSNSSRFISPAEPVQGKLFLLGGYGSTTHPLARCELLALDSLTLEWSRPITVGQIPCERYSHTTCLLGRSQLVVFGGFACSGTWLNDVHILDTECIHPFVPKMNRTENGANKTAKPSDAKKSLQQQQSVPANGQTSADIVVNPQTLDMLVWSQPEISGTPPCPRAAHACCSIGSRMYLFGGNDGQRLYDDLHVLELDEQSGALAWKQPLAHGTPPSARAGHTIDAVCQGTKLVVFGGGNAVGPVNDLHVLDLDSMTWSQPALNGTAPSPRAGHSSQVIAGEQLLIFGGGFLNKVYNDLHCFNTHSNSWSRPSDTGTLPVARAGHTMTAVGSEGEKLIVFGGGDAEQLFADLHVLDAVFLRMDEHEMLSEEQQATHKQRKRKSSVSKSKRIADDAPLALAPDAKVDQHSEVSDLQVHQPPQNEPSHHAQLQAAKSASPAVKSRDLKHQRQSSNATKIQSNDGQSNADSTSGIESTKSQSRQVSDNAHSRQSSESQSEQSDSFELQNQQTQQQLSDQLYHDQQERLSVQHSCLLSSLDSMQDRIAKSLDETLRNATMKHEEHRRADDKLSRLLNSIMETRAAQHSKLVKEVAHTKQTLHSEIKSLRQELTAVLHDQSEVLQRSHTQRQSGNADQNASLPHRAPPRLHLELSSELLQRYQSLDPNGTSTRSPNANSVSVLASPMSVSDADSLHSHQSNSVHPLHRSSDSLSASSVQLLIEHFTRQAMRQQKSHASNSSYSPQSFAHIHGPLSGPAQHAAAASRQSNHRNSTPPTAHANGSQRSAVKSGRQSGTAAALPSSGASQGSTHSGAGSRGWQSMQNKINQAEVSRLLKLHKHQLETNHHIPHSASAAVQHQSASAIASNSTPNKTQAQAVVTKSPTVTKSKISPGRSASDDQAARAPASDSTNPVAAAALEKSTSPLGQADQVSSSASAATCPPGDDQSSSCMPPAVLA